MNANALSIFGLFPMRALFALATVVFVGLLPPTIGRADSKQDVYNNCLLEAMRKASDTDSIALIRETCESFLVTEAPSADAGPVANPGLIARRILLEKEASRNRFAITQHRASYILPVTYDDKPNVAPFQVDDEDRELDEVEAKFQISFKAQLFDSILNDRGRIYFGYTNQSHWQVYDESNSRPFRETNHEPELFIDIDQNLSLGNWQIPLVRAGVSHESNGQSGALSRTWNRLYGEVFFEKEKYAVSLKPWIHLESDGSDFDNPDIVDFMGNFELGVFRQGASSATSVLLRNNLRSENRGAVEFNWSKPLPYNKKMRFLFQYFYGYGESLIDYDALTNRVGIGLQLSDFL